MKFNFGLDQITLNLSQSSENLLWIPAIPARELKAYKGRRIKITPEYLKAAASETKRFYADRNDSFRLPILCAHDDNGRRSGSLVDFAVRKYKDVETLFVKAKFLAESYAAVLNGSLAHGSISILPEYTDPQSGKTYGPFIKEWSETHAPVVKEFTVSELFESPSQLATLNLTLSEDNKMTPEEQNFLDQIAEMIEAKLKPITERLDTLEGGDPEEEETPEDTEGVGNGDAADTNVAASETSNVLDFMDALNARLDGFEKKLDRTARARAKGAQVSTTGVPLAASEKKKVNLSTKKQLEIIKNGDEKLYGIAAVTARKEAENV